MNVDFFENVISVIDVKVYLVDVKYTDESKIKQEVGTRIYGKVDMTKITSKSKHQIGRTEIID